MSTPDVKARAWAWLNSEALACSGCADRLAAIDNDAINRQGRDDSVRDLRERAEICAYLLTLVEAS